MICSQIAVNMSSTNQPSSHTPVISHPSGLNHVSTVL